MQERDLLPDIGLVSWFVGAGDSLTLFTGVDGEGGELVLQVDLNHLEASEDDEEPRVAVIDQLLEVLPRVDGTPYLAALALTHPDQDHCRGFGKLIEKIMVGELWVTPRVFEEYKSDLSEDAKAFKEEAERRLAIATEGGASSGDRVRVIANQDVLESDDYGALPEEAKSEVGTSVESIDGHDTTGQFTAAFCGPLENDDDAERNDTSLAMRVTLSEGSCTQRFLLLGDLAHEALAELIESTDPSLLEFDVLVMPHHCSKGALFDEEGHEDKRVTEGIERAASGDAWAVASSPPIPKSDKDGADPPHRVAWDKYREIFGNDHVVCTGSHGSEADPDPVVFRVGHPCGYVRPETESTAASSNLGAAVRKSRPKPQPQRPGGYGPA